MTAAPSDTVNALEATRLLGSTAWQTYLAEQEAAFADTAEEVIPGLF